MAEVVCNFEHREVRDILLPESGRAPLYPAGPPFDDFE